MMSTKKILDIYSDYLISQNHYATATGLSDLLEGDLSHDQITRFLNSKEMTSKDLWQYVKPQIRAHESNKTGVFIVDDTIEEKAHSKENDTICWHYSHAKGRCVKGANILSGMVKYGDFALPVGFEAIRKDIQYCSIEDKKEHRKSGKTKNELFRSMLKQAQENQVVFDYILADNWFGAKKNMEYIQYDLEKKFIFGLKSNRLVALSEDNAKNSQYQKLSSIDLKDKTTKLLWLKGLLFPVKLLKRIFKNENGSTGVLYLVTNDLSLDTDRIYEIYQERWKIEEYHKSIKQNASLEKSPTKVPKSQRNHIFASIISYCKLEFLKAKTSLNHFALKYKLILKSNQIAFQELHNLASAA